MNDLISVGGVCFVAVEPEKVNADPIGPIRPIRPIGKSAATPEAGTGKRKYRPRGERSRKEQQRAASRHYYREHRTEIAEKQKRYRQEHKDEVREYHRKYQLKYRAAHQEEIARNRREYYKSNRVKISRKAHLAYQRRKVEQESRQSR